ncbi:MAG: hypothetical protein U5L00_06100 [Desulfovermiculus sp.]|nr:hypothetical protein [Desulfovermiculus sp.]
MAKKKGARKKKTDPAKASLEKLESRLLGYWKRRSWGEFVTLFQRHWARAQKTQAAACWDPAVYNLLLDTLFSFQDLSLLQHIVHELIDPQNISEENQRCLQVAKTFLAMYNGQAGTEAFDNLPSDLPAPFQSLVHTLTHHSQSQSTALADYVRGKRTKARKGEKHLALAARIGKQFNILREQDFQPGTTHPFTQLRKSIHDLHTTTQNQLGVSSPTLNNMAILSDLLRTMYTKPRTLINPAQVASTLTQKKFHLSTHPAVESLACAFLAQGHQHFGSDWEQATRVSVRNLLPGLAPVFPQHLEHQFQALGRVSQKDPPHQLLIQEILKQDIWSDRERMILLLAQMQFFSSCTEKYLDYFREILSGFSPEQELVELLSYHLIHATQAFEQIISIYTQLGIEDRSLLVQATHQWQDAVAPIPFLHIHQHLDNLLLTMIQAPIPDAGLLFAVIKRAECASNPKAVKSILAVQDQRAPLKISEQDMQRLIDNIDKKSFLQEIFQAAKGCLAEKDYRQLIQRFLIKVFNDTYEEDELPFFFHSPSLTWTNIPLSLMREFSQVLSPDFSLYGLVMLTLKTARKGPPVPQNATEAQTFLDHLPPPDLLDDMLDWMLTWPSTPYRNTFLAAVIAHHAEHLSDNSGWEHVAEEIESQGLNKLAELVWDIWTELDLFTQLANDEDFYEAVSILQPLARRQKKRSKPSSGKKKKTLLDEVLEERRNKSKKNKG